MKNLAERINSKKIIVAGLFSILLLTSFGMLNSNVFGLSIPTSTSQSVGNTTVSISTNTIVGSSGVTTSGSTTTSTGNTTISTGITLSSENVTNTATATLDVAKQAAMSEIDQVNQTANSAIRTAENNATSIITTAQTTAKSTIYQANQTALSTITSVQNNATLIVNNATETAISKIDQANQTAISEIKIANQTATDIINNATLTAISKINNVNQTVTSSIQTAENNATSFISKANQTAINTINSAPGTAISAITTAQNIGTSSISTVTTSAIAEINAANETTITEVNATTQTAISAINTAQNKAISAINNATQTAISALNTVQSTSSSTINAATTTAVSAINTSNAVATFAINNATLTAVSAINTAQSTANSVPSTITQTTSTIGNVTQTANSTVSTTQNNVTSTIATVNQTATNQANQAVTTAQQDITNAQQALATAGQDIQSAQQTLSANATSTIATVNQTATSNAQQALLIAQNQISNIQTVLSSTIGIAQQEISTTQGTLSFEFSNATSTINTITQNTASTVNQTAGLILPPPTGLTATAVSPIQINLIWNAPSPSGILVTGYKIERSSDDGTNWSTVVSNTGSTATTYSDSGLTASTTYSYRVSAIYPVGTSSPSNTASATTQSTIYDLSVTSQLTTGGPLNGMYAYLMQNGQVVQTGFTPVTFLLNNTLTYSVGIANYPPYAFSYWKDTGSSVSPRTISISSNTQITGVFQDTDLTLSPSKGPTGTTVSVTGTSFTANKTITLTWDGTSLSTNPPAVVANSAGGFNATFQVPNAASSGSHTVQATDGTNTHSTVFTVSPSPTITLNTDSVNVGTDVRVTGANFSPNYMITLSFDGTPIGIGAQDVDSGSTSPSTITTDSNGKFVAIMQTLRTVTGIHTISAKDSVNDMASQTVMVLPHVFIFPTTGKPGANVLIPASQGNGFAANSAIAIKFDGSSIAPTSSITTDAEGNFGGGFIIPSTATTGSHTIMISDGNGNTYSTTLNVDPNAHIFSSQVVASGINFPGYFAFISDGGSLGNSSGDFMVNEKNTGNVDVFKNVNGNFVKQSIPFVTVPNIQTNYETNGLLGIAFDPNWANAITPSKYVYLYVTRNVTGNIVGEVIRYHATTDSSGNIVADNSVGEQLVLGNIPAFFNGHNGGSLKFDSQGNLVISTGDGWQFGVSQDLTSLQGKMLRITPVYAPVNGKLYTIPSTNPFASSSNTSIKKEIWGYGARHPYAFDIDSQTGKIYISDTGFNTWESISNMTMPASNAGWPGYESPPYGNPNNPNYVPPLYWYQHQGVEPLTGPAAGLEALSAGAFYHGTTYPGLDDAYFFGDYGVGNIEALLPSSGTPTITDQASGYPIGQTQPALYGLSYAPIYMEEWNGKLYFLDLNGNVHVLNYN